ncbi:MAG: hypothetical protein GC150_11435 [Rhizobiales bacterium]|nr:hypothetical protein [Hyphomicrobiales bacterium]
MTNTSAFQREFQNQYLDVRNNLGRLRCMGKPSEPLNVVVLRLETRLDGLAPISQSLAIEIHNEIRRAVTGATSRGTGTTISGDNVRVDASPTLPWNAWKRPDFEDNLFNAVHSSSITDDVVLHSTAHLNDAEQLILTARFLGRDAAGSYRNCNDTIILEVPLELLAGDFNASLEETYRGIIEFIYALPASSSQLFREFAAKFPQGDVGLIILLLVGSGLLYIIAIAFRAARRAISLEVGVKPRMATVETLNNTVIRRDPPSLSWGDEP